MLNPNPFYAVLALVHIPVAILLIARIVKRKFVSDSIILHIAFLAYWCCNGVRFGYLGFGLDYKDDFIHVITIIQAICCFPLCVYIFPSFSRSLLLPCIAAYDNQISAFQAKLILAAKQLEDEQRLTKQKVDSITRIVRSRIKQLETLRGLIKESKEYDTLRQEADEMLEELRSANRRLEEQNTPDSGQINAEGLGI